MVQPNHHLAAAFPHSFTCQQGYPNIISASGTVFGGQINADIIELLTTKKYQGIKLRSDISQNYIIVLE